MILTGQGFAHGTHSLFLLASHMATDLRMNHRSLLMRTLLLSILACFLVLPAIGQDSAQQLDSAFDGTWADANDDPQIMLEIESSFRADTLRLTLMGSHAPRAVEKEVIECLVEDHTSGRIEILTCPSTTLMRTSPPSDTTLHFSKETLAREGLVERARRFANDVERKGNSLVMGQQERYRLVRRE